MRINMFCAVLFCLMTSFVGFSQAQIHHGEKIAMTETAVWMGNERGMKNHRILGLTSGNSGTILAFTEARLDGSDEGPHDLVCKRSLDNGVTWSADIMIEKSDGSFWKAQGVDGKLEAWSNPAALKDSTNGRIFIFYVLNEGAYQDKNMQRMSRVFYRVSDDDGSTWSERTEITSVLNAGPDGQPHVDMNGQPIKNSDGFACDYLGRAFHMSGPGHGIQLANGRLLLQFWHRKPIGKIQEDGTLIRTAIDDRLYSSSAIYSDDHGKTWKKGQDTGLGHHANESRIVQLSDGTVMLNARVYERGKRWVALSNDNGETWSSGYETVTAMPYTVVDCGLLRVQPLSSDLGSDWLLHSHPNKLDKREGLTVSLSMDGGSTWPVSKLIYGYGAAYSDLVQLSDGTIGVLYEKKNNHPGSTLGDGIYFVRFGLAQLLGAVD